MSTALLTRVDVRELTVKVADGEDVLGQIPSPITICRHIAYHIRRNMASIHRADSILEVRPELGPPDLLGNGRGFIWQFDHLEVQLEEANHNLVYGSRDGRHGVLEGLL